MNRPRPLKWVARHRPRPIARIRGNKKSGNAENTRTVKVVVLHGDNEDSMVYDGVEHLDDLRLTYGGSGDDGYECAITSQPVTIDGMRVYFTKPQFLGTCALTRDTMLAADAYVPPDDRDDDADDVDVSSPDASLDLWGSSSALKRANRGERMKALLKPQKEDMRGLLLKLGAGAGVGFIAAQYLMGSA